MSVSPSITRAPVSLADLPEAPATAIAERVDRALAQGGGVLRLAPTWVPRSFLHPGNRLKLDPRDLYAFGLARGGIDERWFSSTTEAANEGREADEGLSWVVTDEDRFTLRDAVSVRGPALIGEHLWQTYGRWPVYAKFFDNMGPIPLHMHQSEDHAALVGREGKPEGYYFPPQMNQARNAFPYTFFGLSPETRREDIEQAVATWEDGDNTILNHSVAYRLEPGTGWLVGPGILHAPGSLCTFEPQWGSDVFALFQNVVENRTIGRDLLIKDVPPDRADDAAAIVGQLDWEANVDPWFKRNHYLEPVAVTPAADAGWVDRWVVYGRVQGRQWFSARELTIEPGRSVTLTDPGASGLICVQGEGTINDQPLRSPAMIGFGELTCDEYFIPERTAREGVSFVNASATEPLVVLRYFGPEVDRDAPDVGHG